MKCYRWSQEEDDMLAEMAGDTPWPQTVRAYRMWAKTNGFPERTPNALLKRCKHKKISRVSVGKVITTGLISQLLGIDPKTVRQWLKADYLPYKRYGQKTSSYFILRSDLRSLARERPHLFGGQSVSTLIQLLDNEELAEEIVAMGLPSVLQASPFKAKPVICVETGRRYCSIKAAAKAVYVTSTPLEAAVKDPRRTAAGYHWRLA
jgi:hypothetical protein